MSQADKVFYLIGVVCFLSWVAGAFYVGVIFLSDWIAKKKKERIEILMKKVNQK